MRIRVLDAARGEGGFDPRGPGGLWARFGAETLVIEDDDEEGGADKGEGPARAQRVSATPEQLHVVVQNGREFQEHHPEVPVLHDRGRFLLVQLDPDQAGRLAREDPTCYGVHPLPASGVVFDEPPPAPRAADARVQALIALLSRDRFAANLATLVSFITRESTSDGFRIAADWAMGELGALGYATRLEEIAVGGGTSRNVIAERAGAGGDVVLVTAHLDSINSAGSGAPAPGADDNASGSAGVLEIAHVFQAHQGAVGLRLVLFGGEEQDLLGSRHYVRGLSAAERAKILAVVNMDMIGSLNITLPSVLLEGAALSQDVIDGLHAAGSTYTELKLQTSLEAEASDHVSFLEAGIPAVLTIEGADRTNDRIHKATDTLDHIDHDFALEILRMNVAYVAEMLGP